MHQAPLKLEMDSSNFQRSTWLKNVFQKMAMIYASD